MAFTQSKNDERQLAIELAHIIFLPYFQKCSLEKLRQLNTERRAWSAMPREQFDAKSILEMISQEVGTDIHLSDKAARHFLREMNYVNESARLHHPEAIEERKKREKE